VDLAEKTLLVVHLLGFGALFGGAFVQLRDDIVVVNSAMLYGALTQVVSGLLLVGVLEGQDEPVDNAKVAVKLLVALVVGVLCWVNRAKRRLPTGLFFGILLLTVANVIIATTWT
jgi:Na+-translocating ferredoxin:NAD+ oxidoreductase RnfD subunit